jgi:hypothetical protein
MSRPTAKETPRAPRARRWVAALLFAAYVSCSVGPGLCAAFAGWFDHQHKVVLRHDPKGYTVTLAHDASCVAPHGPEGHRGAARWLAGAGAGTEPHADHDIRFDATGAANGAEPDASDPVAPPIARFAPRFQAPATPETPRPRQVSGASDWPPAPRPVALLI